MVQWKKKASDGTIEAMENKDTFIVCVQWYPERMQEMYRMLFEEFMNKCRTTESF